MAQRASPPIFLERLEADNAQDVADATWHNLERSTVRHSEGFAHGEFAVMPGKHHYDRIQFLFGPITDDGETDLTNVTELEVSVFVRGSDKRTVFVGKSVLGDSGELPAIQFENYQAEYALAVTALDGTTPDVSFDVFVQGVMQGYVQ